MGRVWEVVLAALASWPKGRAGGHPGRDGDSSPGPPGRQGTAGPTAPGPVVRGPARVKSRLSLILRHKMVLLMVGGALGTAARYWLSKWFGAQPWGQAFPYGTFVINVSGSFILAVAAVIILERLPPQHQDWYLLIGTGFCGGYTTFSTFEWETFKLVRDGSWWYVLANAVGSVLAGFVGVLLGVLVGALVANLLFPRR